MARSSTFKWTILNIQICTGICVCFLPDFLLYHQSDITYSQEMETSYCVNTVLRLAGLGSLDTSVNGLTDWWDTWTSTATVCSDSLPNNIRGALMLLVCHAQSFWMFQAVIRPDGSRAHCALDSSYSIQKLHYVFNNTHIGIGQVPSDELMQVLPFIYWLALSPVHIPETDKSVTGRTTLLDTCFLFWAFGILEKEGHSCTWLECKQ